MPEGRNETKDVLGRTNMANMAFGKDFTFWSEILPR